MELYKLEIETLEQLAGAYVHAKVEFDHHDPSQAPPKKQRKMRKWIANHYIELVHELPDECNIFSVQNSDRDVLLFLKECEELVHTLVAQREEKFNSDFAEMPKDIRDAFWELLQVNYWPWCPSMGETLQLAVEDELSYQRILTLHNVKGMPKVAEGYYCSNLALTFRGEENRFCLSGELESFEEEEPVKFSITFDQPSVEVTVYNACVNAVVGENPWEYLEAFSSTICKKAEFSSAYCNAKELEMLPLLKEIANLFTFWWGDQEEPLSFPHFKRLTEEFNIPKAWNLLDAMEKILPYSKSFERLQKRLVALLCQIQYQPFWRKLYNEIADSQAEYPNQVETLCNKEMLTELRGRIQTLMEAKGYTGTYPDFVKKGSLKGIRLAYSYGMSYFITGEKQAEFHVHCEEQFSGDGVYVQFVCGTACLKKGEGNTDIYDCMFNAKGRRLFQTISYTQPSEFNNVEEGEDLEINISIAAKKAECKKLTKEEREYCYGGFIPGFGAFMGVFLVLGGLFGVFMTLGMMIFCAVITLSVGSFSDLYEVFATIPWGLLLAIAWALFGGAMGIVEVLARRK